MALKKKKHAEEGNSERWLLTYSDLITLLMVFFVMMYAISNVNAKKYEQLKDSLGSALSPTKTEEPGGGGGTTSAAVQATPAQTEAQELQQTAAQLQTYLNQSGLQNSVSVSQTERGVVVSLKDSVLFDSGSINIKPEVLPKLVEIGKVLSTVNHYIRVEGNTDNVPMNQGLIKSNLELSVLRATEVAHVLSSQSGIPPDKITPMGYSEYRPIAPNDTPENRAKNRRVDIVVLSSAYNNSEAGSSSQLVTTVTQITQTVQSLVK